MHAVRPGVPPAPWLRQAELWGSSKPPRERGAVQAQEQKRGKPGGQEATGFSAPPASGLCFLRGQCHVWLGCPFLFKWDFNSLTGYFFWRDKIANEL